MAVYPCQKYRHIRKEHIKLLFGRKALVFPVVLVPAPSQNPVFVRVLLAIGLEPFQNLLKRLGLKQVGGLEIHRIAVEMAVRIEKARIGTFSGKVYHLIGLVACKHFLRFAQGYKLTIFDGHGLHQRKGRIHRINFTIVENGIYRLFAAATGIKQQEQHQKQVIFFHRINWVLVKLKNAKARPLRL